MEKIRSLSGDVGVGILLLALFCISIAFGTPAWLISDPSPYESDAPTQFFVGCRWVYDPFTKGYDNIRSFLMPPFMIATQFFFTMCFLLVLISFGLMLLLVLCCGPEEKKYILLIKIISYLLFTSGLHGSIAVIIFACCGNKDGWMPGHENNYFGWSFAMAVVGTTLALIAGILFLTEANIQKKKRKYLKESQIRFQLESNT